MARFITPLPVLLLFSLFGLIVCPNGQVYSGRQNRAPYIESSEHSAQYLTESSGPVGSYMRKGYYRESNANYRNQDQQVEAPRTASQFYNQPNTQQYNNGHTTSTDSVVDKNIRSVFSTNFGPGLHIFPNTAPFVHQPHLNSYTDQMIGDQPDPYSSSSTMSSSDKEFKVQRGSNGELTVVFKDDFAPKKETDTTLQGSGSDIDNGSSNNDSFENKYQTRFPSGHHLTDDKVEPTQPGFNRRRDTAEANTVDCVENDAKSGKPFCTQLRNYPEKSHLEEIIKTKFSNLESFFGEDLLQPLNISQRMNNEPIEEFLCRSRTRVIYPEAGLNKDYDWLFIINTKKYKQGVRIEECINEGSICGESTGLTLPNRYTATCKQNYIYRSLVAYANETIIKDQFKMPSCCKCVLTVS